MSTSAPATPATPAAIKNWQDARFTRSSVFAAAVLLEKAGDRTLAKRFFLHLAESLNATELDQLADLALQMDEPHIALVIAKQAAERGVILPRAYYPVPDFVPDGLKVSRALALSISRRESEFDPKARSSANALGLMQVLPETARKMAAELGLDSTHMNIQIFRARKQLADVLPDALGQQCLLERRGGKIRFGCEKFKIYKGDQLTAASSLKDC